MRLLSAVFILEMFVSFLCCKSMTDFLHIQDFDDTDEFALLVRKTSI